MNAINMTDSEFYRLHKKIGANSLKWRCKFIGMRPEAYKRRLHEKHNFTSIFEYAAKLCGLSERRVREVLNLEEKFQGLPALHRLLVSGEVSSNKLSRVASIATLELEDELSQKVQILSSRALETMVRDFKSENGLGKAQNGAELTHVREFKLSEAAREKLLELEDRGLDANQILLELLEKREADIRIEKDQIAENLEEADSGYIQAKVKMVLKKEYGTMCAVPNCKKPAEHLHHTARFSLTKRHDPRFLAPLCRAHHEIAHAVDWKTTVKRRTAVLAG